MSLRRRCLTLLLALILGVSLLSPAWAGPGVQPAVPGQDSAMVDCHAGMADTGDAHRVAGCMQDDHDSCDDGCCAACAHCSITFFPGGENTLALSWRSTPRPTPSHSLISRETSPPQRPPRTL